MDAILIALAFGFGLVAQRFRLPPMVGFLVAGFVLQAVGREGGETIEKAAELGVTLMLFSIGLKLRIKNLLRPEIWAGTTLHAGAVLLLFSPLMVGLAALLAPAAGLDWSGAVLVAFALSFSSTVFAIKALTENGDLGAMHGRLAIGVLVMQDIVAVLFLTISKGVIPSPWVFALIPGLLLARPLLGWILNHSGHGELVALCGFFLALVVGAKGFDSVGMKADLGALFMGVLVGTHPRAKELKKSLSGITDLLLVGFFLNIGLEGELSWKAVGWALAMLVLLPLKGLGFLVLFTRFKLRARTAWMAAASLSTYSEFGLIVMALGAGKGWIGEEWLVAVALALSLSFLIAAPLNRKAEKLYDPISDSLKKLQTRGRHRDDLPIIRRGEKVAVFGMGRVGLAAYHSLEHRFPGQVIGFDRDPGKVEFHREQERNVMLADATDSDFWERVSPKEWLELVVLAMPSHQSNLHAIETLKRHDFNGVVVASAQYDEEVRELRSLGIDAAFNLYTQAGASFSRHVFNVFVQQRPDLVATWEEAGNESER
ncbi:cation:proton antiporter family protein [Roseibacillus persicicus]|uniref:cation:proton antiporter domain-containing protein n=1 Tax=Roseibacillus persicicus TaxID=454148 RepID=UPI00398A82A8